MENSEKMIMFPYQDFRNILINCLKLAKLNAYNDKLEIRINQEFIKDSNIIDYILDKNSSLKYSRDFNKYLNKDSLFTKVSPIDFKIKSNKKKQSWINI